MKRFTKFDNFLNEKKKASPAQLAARKKFAEMVASKKKDVEPKEEETTDTKEVEKDIKPKYEKKPKDEKNPKNEKETKTEKKSKSKKIASFGEHTGGFKP